jgi:hypothetical protein
MLAVLMVPTTDPRGTRISMDRYLKGLVLAKDERVVSTDLIRYQGVSMNTASRTGLSEYVDEHERQFEVRKRRAVTDEDSMG